MSATEDEARRLDAGWDSDEATEDDVDQAWDSLPPPASAVTPSFASPSSAPATEEVDSGWDDVPVGAPPLSTGTGKRRPHRQRRAKATTPLVGTNQVALPRPAEPSKKHQREHARKQRAYEAQVKQQRKVEKKTQRAAEAREQAAARLRQTEAEAQTHRERREARELAQLERPSRHAVKPKRERTETAKPSPKKQAQVVEAKRKDPSHLDPPRRGLRGGVIVALLAVVVAVVLLLLRK